MNGFDVAATHRGSDLAAMQVASRRKYPTLKRGELANLGDADLHRRGFRLMRKRLPGSGELPSR
ncbi:hypothetical protein SBA4_5730002 [Candidatus Sulfopaludibacter sp. SbA4]|nr:hypothetical protein SBA4_5730002 [Candidatus Sulfopaludibacter sp. SbA4]